MFYVTYLRLSNCFKSKFFGDKFRCDLTPKRFKPYFMNDFKSHRVSLSLKTLNAIFVRVLMEE